VKRRVLIPKLKKFGAFCSKHSAGISVVLSVSAFLVSLSGCLLSREQLKLSRQLNALNVIPEVVCALTLPPIEQANQSFSNPSAVFFNQGPLKIVSLTVKIDTFLFEGEAPTLRAFASTKSINGASPFVLTKAEVSVGETISQLLPMVRTTPESRCLFIIDYAFYREKDMQRFERRKYFLVSPREAFDNEAFLKHGEHEQMQEAAERERKKLTEK
jgi:hypothetical protein